MFINFVVLKGWGLLVFRDKYDSEKLFQVLIYGCLTAVATALLINFFFPLNSIFTSLFGAVGVFCWIKFRSFKDVKVEWPLFFLFLLSALALPSAHENFDTGLYHLPQLQWMKLEATPIGIVNLHARLAFTPVWFPLGAILRFPLLELSGPFVLNIFLLNISLYQLLVWFRNNTSINYFIAALLMVACPEIMNLYRLSSPSTDVPVAILTLMGVIACFVKDKEDVATLLFGFALLIKPLTAPFFIAHLIFNRSSFKARLIPIIVLLLNFCRSILLSGCLIYPLNMACIHALPWTPSPEKVMADENFVTARAKFPLGKEISGHWMSAWFSDFMHSPIFYCLCIICLSLIVYLVMVRKKIVLRWEKNHIILYSVICVGALIWFASAPYVRMGIFYILMIPVFPFLVLFRTVNIQKYAVFFILALYIYQLPPSLKMEWPVIPKQEIEVNMNVKGQEIYRPQKGIKCWDLPLPCTTHFKADIIYEKHFGRYYFIQKE